MKVSVATIVVFIGLAVAAPAAEPVAEPVAAAALEARTCPSGLIVESCWKACKSQVAQNVVDSMANLDTTIATAGELQWKPLYPVSGHRN
ncbi:hypothetical protein V498_01227 [Pseudogymnoascus sp. VKM F-4517 (FW-2822)]|nr:hypothetical protein V498_01227 [Pseudogymnoascus sp. VKM F-4517 (FW-2822)]